jgi:hypothetical protein
MVGLGRGVNGSTIQGCEREGQIGTGGCPKGPLVGRSRCGETRGMKSMRAPFTGLE